MRPLKCTWPLRPTLAVRLSTCTSSQPLNAGLLFKHSPDMEGYTDAIGDKNFAMSFGPSIQAACCRFPDSASTQMRGSWACNCAGRTELQ